MDTNKACRNSHRRLAWDRARDRSGPCVLWPSRGVELPRARARRASGSSRRSAPRAVMRACARGRSAAGAVPRIGARGARCLWSRSMCWSTTPARTCLELIWAISRPSSGSVSSTSILSAPFHLTQAVLPHMRERGAAATSSTYRPTSPSGCRRRVVLTPCPRSGWKLSRAFWPRRKVQMESA